MQHPHFWTLTEPSFIRTNTKMSQNWSSSPIATQQLAAFTEALRALCPLNAVQEPSAQWATAAKPIGPLPMSAVLPPIIAKSVGNSDSTAPGSEELLPTASSRLSSSPSASLSPVSLVQQYAALALYVQLCAAASSCAHSSEPQPAPPLSLPSLETPRSMLGAGDTSSANETFSVAAAAATAQLGMMQEPSLDTVLDGRLQDNRLAHWLSTVSSSTHAERSRMPIREASFSEAFESSAAALDAEQSSPVHVELVDSELWRRFHELGCEMVVTRSGR